MVTLYVRTKLICTAEKLYCWDNSITDYGYATTRASTGKVESELLDFEGPQERPLRADEAYMP